MTKLNSTTAADGTITIKAEGIADHTIIGRPLGITTKVVWSLKSPEGEMALQVWAQGRIELWAQGYFFALLHRRFHEEQRQAAEAEKAAAKK